MGSIASEMAVLRLFRFRAVWMHFLNDQITGEVFLKANFQLIRYSFPLHY